MDAAPAQRGSFGGYGKPPCALDLT